MATVCMFNGGKEVQRWDRVKDASITRQEYGRVVTFEFFDMGTRPVPTAQQGAVIGMRRVTVSGDWAVEYEPVPNGKR